MVTDDAQAKPVMLFFGGLTFKGLLTVSGMEELSVNSVALCEK